MKNKIENEFKKTLNKAKEEIDAELKIASVAIEKAEAISEKYGIPFYSAISPIGQEYRPESIDQKWENIDELEKLLEINGEYLPEYVGWQHSDVC